MAAKFLLQAARAVAADLDSDLIKSEEEEKSGGAYLIAIIAFGAAQNLECQILAGELSQAPSSLERYGRPVPVCHYQKSCERQCKT